MSVSGVRGRAWIALGTHASRELGFFARTAGRRDAAWPVLCLDTDRAPEVLLDERGHPDSARFVALSGFAPRRFAEERLEADRASLAWLSPDAFDQLPREYLHEAPASSRILGRLAYERSRAIIREKLTAIGARAAIGIALDAGGGMSGALLPLLSDLGAACEGAAIDVVLAIDAQNAREDSARRARAYATLRELERVVALPWELGELTVRRIHLVRAFDAAAPEIPYSGLLEIIQGMDTDTAPRDAFGKVDRESAIGRLFESTAHARELDASGRAPKIFFVHGLRELVFPMDILERTLVARYERELIAEALAQDPRRTGRAGQALPRTLLDRVSAAAFASLAADLSAWVEKAIADGLTPLLPKIVDKRDVREGKIEAALEAFRAKLLELVAEVAARAEKPIDEALPRVRAALEITPHVKNGISIPTIAEAAKSAVDQARNLARALESGKKDALTADAFERRWVRLVRKEGLLLAVRQAAESMFSPDRKISEALAPIVAEALLIARERLNGAIASAEARFWRRASISDVRAPEPSPLEAFARSVARLRDGHIAAILTQLDYTAMRKEAAAAVAGKATRLFLPDARVVSEVERLGEFKEIFSPMLPAESGGGAATSFDELAAVLEVIAREDGVTLEEEAASSDPARFVTAMKRAIRGRGRRLLGAKIEPRLSLHLGRLRPEVRAERAAELMFEVPFVIDEAVLDPQLDRPDWFAAGGVHIPEASPLEVRGVHGLARVAWDRLVVDRARCAVPLFAIRDVEVLRVAYEAAIAAVPLHVEAHHLEDARQGRWSLAASRLPTSRKLAEEAKALIPERRAPEQPLQPEPLQPEPLQPEPWQPEQPLGPAVPEATSKLEPAKVEVLDQPPAEPTIPTPPATVAPITYPHPDAIATFALARAVTRALRDGDELARKIERALPLKTERFAERDAIGLIEMERIPGEGWQVLASVVQPAGREFTLGARVALGRYDLAANLLAYAAQPDLVRMHQRFLDVVERRLEDERDVDSLEEARHRLAIRVREQRDAREEEMKEVERTLYDRLLEALLETPTRPSPPSEDSA